jgi:hypothetical protein
MDSTQRTTRLSILREGLEDENNMKFIESAISSIYCRLYTVSNEIFFDICAARNHSSNIISNRNDDSDENDDYYEDSEEDFPNREEFKLIVNKLLDIIKEELKQ